MTFFKGKKRRLRFPATLICLFIGMLIVSTVGFAAQEQQTAKTDSIETVTSDTTSNAEKLPFSFPVAGSGSLNILGLLGKTIGYLALIIILIIGLVYFLKKFVYNKNEKGVKGTAVKVLSSTFVSQKKSVLLIEAVGRVLLVSVTDSNMALLTEINKDEYDTYLENNVVEKPKKDIGMNQFNEVLSKVLKRSK
ncbi:MAG: flagellar biosynthetic protein FliO [bacterium]|nr:flagellar biosynthetic protein FliO [bacterium]